ncbi:regulator of microtubule dynamics protein 1-like [Nilaparvata lugens]|uniref:regulator of microtubule dynamics protein 1-like n=1 Tax=Nilaparvata lugens TaxID=108931 RepID=UPI00193CCD0C|nr:regulator of microtubule dynamics protein 1-like [Nilaparvata lugens]
MFRSRLQRAFLLGIFDFVFKRETYPQHEDLTERELDEQKRREVINKSDDFYNTNRHEEACLLLTDYKNSGDTEVLWRLARAKYMQYDANRDTNRQHLIVEAYDVITRALRLGDDKYSVLHKWYAVLLDEKSAIDGLRQRIQALEKVKEHLLQANKLDPLDTSTLYLLGSWCYHLADMTWMQRKMTATLFARAPTATFEEALTYFKMAEDAKPNFYCRNLLMLGKTYLKLGYMDRARYYLKQASEHIVNVEEDLRTHAEARRLLKELGE